MPKFYKNKIFLSVFVGFFVLVQIFGVFFARPVYAIPVEDFALQSLGVNQVVKDNTEKALLSAALGSLVSGASYFMRKLAYDSAKYIASGGKGQGALAFQEGPGEYFKNLANDTATDAIGSFGSSVGLNLCQPASLKVLTGLQTSLSNIYNDVNSIGSTAAAASKAIGDSAKGGTYSGSGSDVYGAGSAAVNGGQAKCSWSEFKNNWSEVPDMFGKDSFSERFASSLDATQSDFGVALAALSKLDQLTADKKEAALVERLEGNGFKAVKETISNKVKTPASTVAEESKSGTAKSLGEQSASQIAGLYGSQAVSIIPAALSVFTSTLVSDLLAKIFTKGTLPQAGGDALDFAASTLNNNRKIADSVFSFLVAGVPQRSLSNYDIINQYSSCNDNPGLNNCVMDGDLVQVLQRARSGNPMTISEALDPKSNFLHGSWQLIPPTDIVNNTDRGCYNKAYCYSNIQKLRKARILPLGFEIAAQKSNPDNPVTLAEVVSRYNDCNDNLIPDSAHPYCHLIDPNWLLEVPDALCESTVIGPQLAYEDTNQRASECADFSTCLAYDDKGQCKSFGYCTQEKNVWDMPGQSCPEQFATCKTYTSQNGTISSYLSRTIDYGTCNISSVGCKAYSTYKINENWVPDNQINLSEQSVGNQQVLYFNNKIDNYTCPDSENGCSLFLYQGATTTQDVYLKKAPEYLGCYDANPATPYIIDWPQSKSDLTKLAESIADPQKCSDFSQVCIEEEVGCEEYSSKNGGTSLTGVVGNNYCPNSCVGYETFKQEKTNFEGEKFPLYFIPSKGQSCAAQYVGCDEFTSLAASTGEKLEYYSDLKYCQQPDSENAKTYYSWEGSDTQGYVLKKHNLLQVDATAEDYLAGLGMSTSSTAELAVEGSPAYVNDNKTVLEEENFKYCNATNYDLLVHNPFSLDVASSDCRALYDDAGKVYYRLLSETVTISEQCQPLRKTSPEFYKDNNLINSTCLAKGGKWDGPNPGGSCMRCTNGGTYVADGNYCKYWSIATEAESCPAVVNGCRLYIGNTGNNLHDIYNTSFEPSDTTTSSLKDAKLNWGNNPEDINVTVETEATQVGSHSLKVHNGTTKLNLVDNNLNKGSWYELSFWARGDSSKVVIYFGDNANTNFGNFTVDPLTGNNIPVNIGFDWKEYKLGPVMYTGDSANNIITFAGDGHVYFIDNVRLVSMGDPEYPEDYSPLIKDSWKTDEGYDVSTVCDFTPLDPYPGEYLGCSSYTARDGKEVDLTGFQNLCRAEAVGCVGLSDTNDVRSENYLGAGKLIYNPLCVQGATNVSDVCSLDIDADGNNDYSCTVEKGQTSCYISGPIQVADNSNPFAIFDSSILDIDTAYTTTSTVAVDVPNLTNSDLVYLTVRNEYLCDSNYLGCQEVGNQNQVLPTKDDPNSYEFGKKFIVNNVNNYGDTLCTEEQISCQQFTSNNTLSFFKDPTQNGALCTYKESTLIGGNQVSGWFFDGIGRCDDANYNYCRQSDDCAEDVTCVAIGLQACYPDYLSSNNEYGLWSNSSAGYQGFVGTCNATYDQCTELIDPTDNQRYTVIANDDLFAKNDECQGKVNQTEGCVLFDQTENPNKFYDSVATYDENKKQDYTLVDPITVLPSVGDSNLLIKVNRERQCGEWLACSTSKTEIDANGVAQELCLDYKSCNKLGPDGKCAAEGWVKPSTDTNQRLTETAYIQRNSENFGKEYSGYSLFNKYDLSNYVYFGVDGHEDEGNYIAYEVNDRFFGNSNGEDYTARGCFAIGAGGTPVKNDGEECGIENGGRCYQQKCLYPIDTVFNNDPKDIPAGSTVAVKEGIVKENVEKMLEQLEHGTCKAYPEKSSPFNTAFAFAGKPIDTDIRRPKDPEDLSVRYEYNNINSKYSKANICQFADDGTGNSPDCSCDYIKVEYKNGTIDYWPSSKPDSVKEPEGICAGSGDFDGQPCSEDINCRPENNPNNSGGICYKQKQKGTYIGTKGICLEYDLSRPLLNVSKNSNTYKDFACLTWLPVQVSMSAYDLYNTALQAGYYPVSGFDSEKGGLAYCKEAASAAGTYDGSMTPLIGENDFMGGCSIVNTEICNGTFLGDTVDVPFLYSNNYEASSSGNYGTGNNTVFEKTNDQNTIETYAGDNGIYFEYMMQRTNDSEEEAKEAYRALQIWGWRNLSTSARLLRLDLQNDNDKERSMFNYNGSNSPWPSDKTSAMFSFAPVLTDTGAEDTGTAMHPPRKWTSTFDVPKNGVFNYFVNAILDTNDLKHIETTAFSPDFKASSEDNIFIYVDSSIEKNINEYMLDRIYFVPTIFPDKAEGVNPIALSNQFYIDFTKLRESLKPNSIIKPSDLIPSALFACGGSQDNGNKSLCNSNTYPSNARVFSYVLEREKDSGESELSVNSQYGESNNNGGFNSDCATNGLVSFCKYNSDFLNVENIQDKNQIYRRYVVLFYNQDNYTPMVDATTGEPKPIVAGYDSTDPFTRKCEQKGANNFLAIGMDFNKDGEFLGYISRWCEGRKEPDPLIGSSSEGNGISFATFAQFNNVCTDVASVVNDDNQQLNDYNKAWTDRVWEEAINPFAGWSYSDRLNLTSDIKPYGSLESYMNQRNLDVNSVQNLPAYIRFYSFPFNNNTYGIPYICNSDTGLFPGRVASGVTASNCANVGLSQLDSQFYKGTDYSSLSILFNKYYTEWKIPTNNKSEQDFSGTNLGSTQPPKIFAVNYLNCDNRQDDKCTSMGEGFTINSRNYPISQAGYLLSSSEDKDKSGVTDPIIAQGSYRANVRFFAYADDNRMPIKRVMVNWDDGSNIYDVTGAYMNRKPYCTASDVGRCTNRVNPATWREGDPQLTCQSNDDCKNAFGNGYTCDLTNEATKGHFGDSDRACTPQKPFESTHTYFCDLDSTDNPIYTLAEIQNNTNNLFGSTANAQEAYNKLIGKRMGDGEGEVLGDTSPVCVFKPGVQVLDNWGWCNGSCVASYSWDNVNKVTNPVGTASISNSCYSLRNIASLSSTIDQCDKDSIVANDPSYPFTPYNGAIIVIP
ncbi:MAG: hypothetical protein PHQ18_03200 [Patescibacteria group bacterium]|nr:hypothetical protein [Patescibacteria group bacterium]